MENDNLSNALLGSLPAEWEPQCGTLLAWPTAGSDWKSNFHSIQDTYVTITACLVKNQQVIILCQDDEQQCCISDQLHQAATPIENIRFLHIATNDTWIRDYAPIFLLTNNNPLALNFRFNAWGEQYPYALDNAVNAQLLEKDGFKRIKRIDLDLIFEGGNIDSDGQGHLLCNLKCINGNNEVDGNSFAQIDLQKLLSQHISFTCLHCLELDPLLGDDTGGHIDTLARFLRPGVIAYAHSDSPTDPNRLVLDQLFEQLSTLRDRRDNPYQLEPIAQPSTLHTNAVGEPLPANYLNFTIANQLVLVPQYNDPQDHKALICFQKLFPKHEIIGIDSTAMIEQFGSLHCSTMHIPIGVLDESRSNTASL